MLLKRTEFLGDHDGKEYLINPEDQIFFYKEDEKEIIDINKLISNLDICDAQYIENELDSLADGYNELQIINEEMFETMYIPRFGNAYICRKAYMI